MDIIKGCRVKLVPFQIEDAFFMKNWGKHEDILLNDYNFPYLEDKEITEWYNSIKFGIGRKYFGVHNEEERLIGYLGIKGIRKIRRQATLGVVFDPNYVNKGYGTDAIKTFLEYFFNEMKMKTLLLEVAKFNKRAIRCYEKCGFVKYGEYLDKYYTQSININNPYFKYKKDCFVIKRNRVYNYIYKMKIDKKTHDEIRGKNDKNKI